jgi:hypothetical protein
MPPYNTQKLIDQSRAMLEQTKAQGTTAFAGSTYDTNRTGAVQAITPSAMASTAPIVPVTTPTTPVATPAPVEVVPNVALTGEENTALTQQDSLQSIISDLTLSTSDRAQKSFQQQQQETLGYNAAQNEINQYSDVAKSLSHEADQINIQLKNSLEQLQVNAQQSGANVTKGGLDPQRRALQTQANQQLLDNAVKQHTNNASLYASQGKLRSAIDSVNYAVNAEFDPKFKALETAQANLSNLMKSGVLTTAEKKKAMNLQAQYDAQKEQIATDKANATTIQGMVLQAQQNGAPNALIGQARNAKDLYEVAQILSGWTNKETGTAIAEYNYYKRNEEQAGRVPLSFDAYQTRDANRKIAIAKAGVASTSGGIVEDAPLYSGLSPQTSTAVRSQVSRFSSEPTVQNFAIVQEGNNFAQAISEKTKNPAEHQAIIYALAKALDPGSVVREGEYATAQKYAQSWINAYGKGIEQAINGTGFLSEDAIRNIKATIAKKYEASNKSYTSLENNFAQGINDLTGRTDGAKFLRSYRTALEQTPQTKSAFVDVQSKLTIDPTKKTATIPRSVWSTLGDRMDALLAEAKADGYTLLVTD